MIHFRISNQALDKAALTITEDTNTAIFIIVLSNHEMEQLQEQLERALKPREGLTPGASLTPTESQLSATRKPVNG